MPLTKYGTREWSAITVLAIVAAVLLTLLGSWWAIIVVAVIWMALVAFFRDPIRRVPDDLPAGVMLSPADGHVTAVLDVDHHDATGGPAKIVRIFLSVLDVHVNRAPCDGEVAGVHYTPGRFHDARAAEAVTENESNLITLDIGGETLGVRQISGKLARRIVCRAVKSDRLKRGQKYGMIKFGSCTELILPRPEAVTVHVTEGEKVKGGLTLLATLAPAG